MLKTLQKKLKSPHKSVGALSHKHESKTQRVHYDNKETYCEETIRKNEHTDRKTMSVKPFKNYQ